MSQLRRIALRFALVLALLPATGCEWKPVTVQLSTFFSAGVSELWFWRLDEQGEDFERDGHMRFSSLVGPPGAQSIRYTMVSPEGIDGLTLTVPVQVVGDSIIVSLWFARWTAPGTFRLSSRNLAGESGLSAGEIGL